MESGRWSPKIQWWKCWWQTRCFPSLPAWCWAGAQGIHLLRSTSVRALTNCCRLGFSIGVLCSLLSGLLKRLEREPKAGEIWGPSSPLPLPRALWDLWVHHWTSQCLAVFPCKLISVYAPLTLAGIMFRGPTGQSQTVWRFQEAKYCWNTEHCCCCVSRNVSQPERWSGMHNSLR